MINDHAALPECGTCRGHGIFYDSEVCGDCWGTGYDFTEVEQKAKAEAAAEKRARIVAWLREQREFATNIGGKWAPILGELAEQIEDGVHIPDEAGEMRAQRRAEGEG